MTEIPYPTDAKPTSADMSRIAYRTGSYASFLKRMRDRVHATTITRENGTPTRPLARMDTRLSDSQSGEGDMDFGMALIDAWAMVCDILAFYGERFINEHYLFTCEDETSIRELLYMLGFQPDPGLAAEAWVAFTVAETRGAPKESIVSKGSPIQSVPGQNEDPQWFETSSDLHAYSKYNRFKPVPARLGTNYTWYEESNYIHIKPGVRPKVGTPILIIGSISEDQKSFSVRTILDIKSDRELLTLQLSPYLAHDPHIHARTFQNLELYTFGGQNTVFGNQAMPWKDVPDNLRLEVSPPEGGIYTGLGGDNPWNRANYGLPDKDLRYLLADKQGYLYASLAESGLYRSANSGLKWEPIKLGLTSTDILSMAVDRYGTLYAGAADGTIFRSRNRGHTWQQFRGYVGMDGEWSSLGGNYKIITSGQFTSEATSTLPEVAVLALLPSSGTLPATYANIEDYFDITKLLKLLNPKNWFKFVKLLSSGSAKTASTIATWVIDYVKKAWCSIRDRLFKDAQQHIKTGQAPNPDAQIMLFAGTDAGVYRFAQGVWLPVNKGMPGLDEKMGTANVLINCLTQTGDRIIAGSDHGIFSSDQYGNEWKASNQGLPDVDEETGYTSAAIQTLMVFTDRDDLTRVFCGTPKGLFQSEDGGDSWARVDSLDDLVENASVTFLDYTETADGRLILAATDSGLFSSNDDGLSWDSENRNLRLKRFKTRDSFSKSLNQCDLTPDLRAVFDDNGYNLSLYAYIKVLVQDASWLVIDEFNCNRYQLDKAGQWLKVSMQVNDIRALAAMSDGTRAVATPLGTYQEDEWPNFWIHGNQIDLSRKEPGATVGDIILLRQDELSQYYKVVAVSTVERNDFGLRGIVTRLTVDHNRDLLLFDPRKTEVFLLSTRRYLATMYTPDLQPVVGNSITVNPRNNMKRGRQLIVTGKSCRVRPSRQGGVGRTDEGKPGLLGMQQRDPRAVALDSTNLLHVGTSSGVWRLTDSVWEFIGLEGMVVTHLVIDHTLDEIYAAVDENPFGSYLFRLRNRQWQPLDVSEPLVDLAFDHGRRLLYALTASALWFSADRGGVWRRFNASLTHVIPRCLLINPFTGEILVGTNRHGILITSPDKFDWHYSSLGMTNKTVNCIAISADGDSFYAGTEDGVFKTNDRLASWSSIHEGLDQRRVTALACADELLYVGTYGGGLARRAFHTGASWSTLNLGASNHVVSMMRDRYNEVVFASRSESILFDLAGRNDIIKHRFLFKVNASWLERENFMDILAQPFQSNDQELSDKANLVVSNQEPNAWMLEDEERHFLIFQQEQNLLVFEPAQSLIMSKASTRQGNTTTWFLQNHEKSFLPLETCAQDFVFMPSFESDPISGEAILLESSSFEISRSSSELTFQAPLKGAYDRDTITVYGNVVMASHGRTSSETLGSGESSKANQQFRLKGSMLTWLNTNRGPTSTLSVIVNPDEQKRGMRWHEVDSLYNTPADARAFVTRIDGNGNLQLIFGDGHNGTRLPTGKNNVAAQYRQGIGKQGNVKAESLTQLMRSPLGVRAVTNPLPAEGGVDPASPRGARSQATVQVRPLERIISLRDCHDFVLLYPGIEKVTEKLIIGPHGSVGHLTIALEGGNPLDKDSTYFQKLVKTIENARGNNSSPLLLDDYRPRYFNVHARILPRIGADPNQVHEDAIEALMNAYNFDSAVFERSVTITMVAKTLQDVEGISSVDVQALYFEGASPSAHESLKSDSARYDASRREIIPATLLMLKRDNIQVENWD